MNTTAWKPLVCIIKCLSQGGISKWFTSCTCYRQVRSPPTEIRTEQGHQMASVKLNEIIKKKKRKHVSPIFCQWQLLLPICPHSNERCDNIEWANVPFSKQGVNVSLTRVMHIKQRKKTAPDLNSQEIPWECRTATKTGPRRQKGSKMLAMTDIIDIWGLSGLDWQVLSL